MHFIVRLLADYTSAYRIAVVHYRAFPYHLSFATAFAALIAGLDALIPYFLREAANRFSSKDRTVTAYAILLDEPLGIQGRTLSGGERQRIALGRALARCPGVLILDEPTSSLDPAREVRILDRIRRRVPTIIVITHRDALWKAADRIYEVGGGCVRELGAIDAERPFRRG
jgi:ABC-type transport system involved in cytochrome bd biosynthesis fused ATPase/permease subunit